MSASASAYLNGVASEASEAAAAHPVKPRSPVAAQAPVAGPVRLPAGLSAVLAVLSSSAVVLDSDDLVLEASEAARSFGLVEGDKLVVGELLALARQVRRDGEIREGEMDGTAGALKGRTTSFAVRVAPLGPEVGGGGLVLLLVEDQTERRRVEEVRRDFVANTSHELKTPVGALAEPIPDPVPVDLDAVVAEALDRGRMKATSRGIELASTGTRRLTVLGEEELLVTALRNLLDNAVAYSPEKTRVVVSTRMAGRDIVELSVSDEGIGIPERDLERIFERFYRVDPARSRVTGGTGLGLAIVKHVTAAHGGKVTVTSKEGAGSTFTLRLPARPGAPS